MITEGFDEGDGSTTRPAGSGGGEGVIGGVITTGRAMLGGRACGLSVQSISHDCAFFPTGWHSSGPHNPNDTTLISGLACALKYQAREKETV